MAVIKVKASNDTKYDVTVADLAATTVSAFKELVAVASSIPAAEQRLIYSGKVLKDADMLATYKVRPVAVRCGLHGPVD
jgi:ubiquilin